MSVAAAVALAAALATAPGAKADFHTLCAGDQPISAGTTLNVADATFTFGGMVACGDATLSIDALELAPLDGTPTSAPPVSCSGCGSLSTSATAPAATGIVDLRMSFTVSSAAGATTRHRTARYVYGGQGSPTLVRVCSANRPANAAGC